jgi:hypothetical protein
MGLPAIRHLLFPTFVSFIHLLFADYVRVLDEYALKSYSPPMKPRINHTSWIQQVTRTLYINIPILQYQDNHRLYNTARHRMYTCASICAGLTCTYTQLFYFAAWVMIFPTNHHSRIC